jgi:hypothetical protein
MRDEGLSGLSLFFSFNDNPNPSLHTPSSKSWRESRIVLRENYNGERTKTFRLYVAGYEGVFRRGCVAEIWKLSVGLIPRTRIENRR